MMTELTHIDLFSGIGGFAYAARQAGFRTVAFCERDEFCQKVLAKNFGTVVADTNSGRREQCKSERQPYRGLSGKCEQVPIIPDIFDFDGTAFAGATLLTGGFPCQPFSCAGKRRGKEDDRAIWPQMARVIAEARPTWVIGENVRGLVTMELDNVLSDLERIGYAAWPVIVPACAVDARHRRDRVWIVAHSDSERGCLRNERRQDASDAGQSSGSEGGRGAGQSESRMGLLADGLPAGLAGYCSWPEEPQDIPRVATGVKDRVNKLKGLGNAIVPSVAFELIRMIAAIELGGHERGKYERTR